MQSFATKAAHFLLPFALCVPAAALAQDAWPARTVRLVVPSSPGGATDTYARLLAQGLGDTLKRQFIVDNRPGASGNVGAEIAAKAAPDGYTFLISSSASLVINPSLYKNLPYSAERDFTPVARGVISPIVLTAHPSVPAKTLPALIALGKREPGKLTYGTPGAGTPSNMAVKMVEEAAGVRFLLVPYKGAAQAVLGVLRGEVAFMGSDVNTVLPHVQSKKMVPLVTSHRTPHLPGTPSFADAGYPQVDAYPSFSVVAPTGTPSAIIQRMSAEIVKLMKTPSLREKLDARALIPVFDTPDEFAIVLKKERAQYAELIRRNNIVSE
jgi:tripartite-type tricarboxylate transporter receptor subunit TctC